MDALQQVALRRAQAALQVAAGDERQTKARAFVRRLAKGGAYTRALVGAMDRDDIDGEAGAFFSLVHERSLLGRIAGLRRVPAGVRTITPSAGAQGFWIAEGAAMPLSKPAIDGAVLRLLRVSSIICMTREALERGGPVAEALLLDDLLGSLTGALDWALVDPGNGGITDEIPASIAHGQTQIPSAGSDADSVLADFRALFAAFAGDFSRATLVMHPQTTAQICLLQKPLGESSLTVTGGSLFGLPVHTSRAVPVDSSGASSILMVDASSIAYDYDGGDIAKSPHATLEMSDTPSGNSATPTGSELVNLWQSGTIAWRADLHASWRVHGTDRVVSLTGVDYSAGES